MDDLDLLKRELSFETERCADLFDSHVLVSDSLFAQSAFIELVIRLNYVLQKLNSENRRVDWGDDVLPVQHPKDPNDITSLVNRLRNAACHAESPECYLYDTRTKFVFNRCFGKGPIMTLGNGQVVGGEYEDEVAFYYGANRIYLNRHIKRLLEELPGKIDELA
jgi:hypothetical protein